MEFWNSALGQRWHLAIQRLAEVTSSSVYLCRYGGKLARYSIKIWVFWGIKWWYKQRWSLKMITINIKRYDNWLLPECVWYGEVLCDGAVIIVSLKNKTYNLKKQQKKTSKIAYNSISQDLHRWWFESRCSNKRMIVKARSWEEVVKDPRFKP